MLGTAMLAVTSCGDADEEITSYTLARNLSPINLDTKNVSETTATISWTQSAGATSYNLEVFADDSLRFDGSPAQTITGITPEQIPVSLSGLFFDTQYSVRVQAVTEGNDSRTSTWNGVYFKTSAKQFMKNPKPADIADRSVTISWETEDGFDVSTIIIGNITHEITAEEKAAGKATVEGLDPETTYTAYLYYNGKQCGNRSFTTIADLAGAVLVHDTDNLKDIIENASGGEVFALYGGEYLLNVNEEGKTGAVKVGKSITIKGIYPTDQPVLKGRFELNDGAGLTLSQVVVDGTENATTDQIFNFKTDGASYRALDIENSVITGQKDCKGILYLNVTSTVENIIINNSIVYGIECNGGDFIDSRKGLPKQVTLTKSTFYNVATSRDFLRIDDASGSFEGQNGPDIKIDQCTFYNVGGGAANYRLLYARFAGNKITFTSNLVVGTNYKRGFTNQKSTDPTPTLQNNHYWNCQNLTSAGDGADATITWFDENGIIDNPQFADADKADFTLGADAAARKNEAGDPRWRK
ncbi:MAG: fibronectin type III domain-containing protein [Prevotella sp.]|nr:fibronectin type III domain-containing protein [Prevotella sp.]